MSYLRIFFVFLVACSTTGNHVFNQSSIDVNEGRPHFKILEKTKFEEAMDKIISVGKINKYQLVDKICLRDTCHLGLQGGTIRRSKSYVVPRRRLNLTKALKLSIDGFVCDHLHWKRKRECRLQNHETYEYIKESKIFIEIENFGKYVTVEMIGVPILNGIVSCPKNIRDLFFKCDTKKITVAQEKTIDAYNRKFDYDLSGEDEAKFIKLVLLHLY